EGFRDEDIRFMRLADCRYLRQVYTVEVRIEEDDLATEDTGWLTAKYERAYEALFQHIHKKEAGFVDTVRVAAFGRLPDLNLPKLPRGPASAAEAQRGTRQIYTGEWTQAP